MWWYWQERDKNVDELVFDFTIHSDPGDFSDRNGLYFMVCYAAVGDDGFYFGLQTDVRDPTLGAGRGKGLIFSRWGDLDLTDARIAGGSDGWAQESGHEGDFIGVRRAYEWDTGDYRMWMASDGEDSDGEWYGVWLTDLDTGETLWVGSLQFPFTDGDAVITTPANSVLEIYGPPPVRPIDIPEWHVSLDPPDADGKPAGWALLDYGGVNDQNVSNSDIQWLDGQVHMRVGGVKEQVGAESETYLDIR